MTEIDEKIRHLEAEIKRLNSKAKLYKPADLNEISRPGTIYTPADGWLKGVGTWTYASATTITVPSGAASIYKVGQGIKLTQTDVKYFYIVGVADTVLTITGGSDYTLANAAISAISYTNTPGTAIGFPSVFGWAPTCSATSGTPTVGTAAYFSIHGRKVHTEGLLYVSNANGATGTLFFTLPTNVINDNNNSGRTGSGTNGSFNLHLFYTLSANKVGITKYDGTSVLNTGLGANFSFDYFLPPS